MKLISRICIFLFLACLATAPPVLYGYSCLSLAQSADDDVKASMYYESAARMLIWQPGLYEKAGLRASADPQRAIRLLEIARRQHELGSASRLALGDAYLAIKETKPALYEWEKLLSENKYTAEAAERLAQQYHSVQDYSNEQRVLEGWLKSDPSNPQANEQLGVLLAASAAPEALSMLQIASSQSTPAANRLNYLITALRTPGEDIAYKLALSGQALARIGEWTLAEKAFGGSAEANPQYANAWAWLGTARQHNKSSGALSALETAVRLEPDSAAIHAMLGNYLVEDGEPQKAIPEFRTATEIEPTNPAWWQGLAGAEAQTDLTAALSAYIKTVNIAPGQAVYWYGLAAFCIENNAYLEDYGLNAALRAYAIEPKNPEYIDMLGRAQMATGQLQAAEVSFNKAISLGSPSSVPAYHFHLGLLYIQSDRPESAKVELEECMRLDPNGIYGSQAKKLIERYFPQK